MRDASGWFCNLPSHVLGLPAQRVLNVALTMRTLPGGCIALAMHASRQPQLFTRLNMMGHRQHICTLTPVLLNHPPFTVQGI